MSLPARGRVSPESFTHGSARERTAWFRRGLESGDLKACDTFAVAQLYCGAGPPRIWNWRLA